MSYYHCKKCDVEWNGDNTCWLCSRPGDYGGMNSNAVKTVAIYSVNQAEESLKEVAPDKKLR